MTEPRHIVFAVDDDPVIRDSPKGLPRSVGLLVKAFGSPREFLRSIRPDAAGCLVLDVGLLGPSGLMF